MTSDVSKGRALKFVLNRLDIDTAHCVAFGDNMNDIDLLETAGRPFMMKNANPDLARLLPNIPRTGNNFEAGVAHQLRSLFSMNDKLTASDRRK
jgi:hydroxymethylpyrimidine pyrophosphatase-like HAD family hydrolase